MSVTRAVTASVPAIVLAAALALPAPARAEPVQLKFGTTAPPGSHIAKFFDRWAASVNKVDPKALKLKVYHNTLGNTRTMYDSIQNGVADIGWFNPSYYAGQFHRIHVTRIPRMAPSAEYGSVTIWRLYKKGMWGHEFDKVVPIGFHSYPPSELHFSRPIKSMDEIKGLKIGTISRSDSEAIKELGAAPLSVGLYQYYQSLQKHMIDGISGGWTMFMPFKLYEVTKYHLPFNMGNSDAVVAMNKQSYAKLPENARKALMSKSGEYFSRLMGKFWDRVAISGQKFAMKRSGHVEVKLPEDQLEKMYTMVEPAYADWIKNTPGAAELIKAFKAEYAAVAAGKMN